MRDPTKSILQTALDLGLTLLSLYLASWARHLIPWGVALSWERVALPWPVYVLTAVIWPLALSLSSAYSWTSRPCTFLEEALHVVSGTALGLLVLAGALYFSYRLVPRRLFFYFGVLDTVCLVLPRGAGALIRRFGRHDTGDNRVLVVGAGDMGARIAKQLEGQPAGLNLVGFVDDDPTTADGQVAGVPIVGRLDDLVEVVRSRRVHEVVFALPLRAHERLVELVQSLEGLPVEVDIVPDYFDLAFYRTQTAELLGIPLIRLRASAIEGRSRALKRFFDLALSIPILILGLPFLPLVALAIRVDSHGPVFFGQERVGENCRRFTMWKLRTMVANAEELLDQFVEERPDGVVLYKRPGDPRVTRVGRLLRRYSLDELPQLINVIRGEMSLVGPRPELPWMVDRYSAWQRKRFAAPPGITGWWQVSGRAERDTHVRVEDDLYYIQNYSLWLDLRILWLTIGAVLSGKGAY